MKYELKLKFQGAAAAGKSADYAAAAAAAGAAAFYPPGKGYAGAGAPRAKPY